MTNWVYNHPSAVVQSLLNKLPAHEIPNLWADTRLCAMSDTGIELSRSFVVADFARRLLYDLLWRKGHPTVMSFTVQLDVLSKQICSLTTLEAALVATAEVLEVVCDVPFVDTVTWAVKRCIEDTHETLQRTATAVCQALPAVNNSITGVLHWYRIFCLRRVMVDPNAQTLDYKAIDKFKQKQLLKLIYECCSIRWSQFT